MLNIYACLVWITALVLQSTATLTGTVQNNGRKQRHHQNNSEFAEHYNWQPVIYSKKLLNLKKINVKVMDKVNTSVM